MPHPKKTSPAKIAEITRLRVEERRTGRSIAKIVGVSHHVVNKALKAYPLTKEEQNRYRTGKTYRRNWKRITWYVNENGCHVNTSHTIDVNGYPLVSVKNTTVKMHRALYEKEHGKLPDGIVVRHTCDNRRCINMDHLTTGTVADNNRDRVVRGRDNPHWGETRSDAKLSEQDVVAIRDSSDTNACLSDRYGVSRALIRGIKDGKKRKRDGLGLKYRKMTRHGEFQ